MVLLGMSHKEASELPPETATGLLAALPEAAYKKAAMDMLVQEASNGSNGEFRNILIGAALAGRVNDYIRAVRRH